MRKSKCAAKIHLLMHPREAIYSQDEQHKSPATTFPEVLTSHNIALFDEGDVEKPRESWSIGADSGLRSKNDARLEPEPESLHKSVELPALTVPTEIVDPASESLEQPHNRFQGVLAQYSKIARLQDRLLTNQTRLQDERDTGFVGFQDLREALHEFMTKSRPDTVASETLPSGRSSLDIHNHLLHVVQDVEERMQHVTAMEQTFTRLACKLARLQPKLLESIGNLLEDISARSRTQSGSSSEHRPLSEVSNRRQQDYYAKRGIVRLLQTKVFNLNSKLQQLPQRVFEDPVAVDGTEEAPLRFKRYDTTRQELQTELESKQTQLEREEQDLENLWNICREYDLEVGPLEPEIHRVLPSADSDTQSAPIEDDAADIVENDTANDVEDETATFFDDDTADIGPTPFLPDGFMSEYSWNVPWLSGTTLIRPVLAELANFDGKRDSIEQWAHKLPKIVFGPAQPSTAIKFEHAVSPTKDEPGWLKVRCNSA